MNIVMVGPFGLRPLGTMSARALPIARALAARGHSVTIVMPPWQNPEDAGTRLEEAGVTVDNVPLPPRIPGLFHLLVAATLVGRVRRARPDVVHLFKPKAYSGLVHWLLRALPRRRLPPVVVDADDWEGPGGWNELGEYTSVQRAVFAWQERWGLTRADAVTVASRTLESLAWALGVPAARTFYVPNGTEDRAGAALPPPRSADSGPVILLYTRFVEFSVTRVLELLARVVEHVPAAELLVVGEGLRREADHLLALARERGLSRNVSCVGWDPALLSGHVARAALAIYPLDDTLVNRSKSPAKLMTLLASGVPVVADGVGEAREFIRDGETGWLVDAGDVEKLSAAVVGLLRTPELRRRLGSAAAQDVRARFGWSRSTETVLRAYAAAGSGK